LELLLLNSELQAKLVCLSVESLRRIRRRRRRRQLLKPNNSLKLLKDLIVIQSVGVFDHYHVVIY
jgi:hypothetical protein